ncbi:hypothetical protein FGO68_gene5633 [Halteria grandinella]|uniref:Uncharacterized protein n=1 Tax=Halteria grandinella TaxID=5974 RepID=A0A8J8T8B4_HALGN|nr:hypothetical protein FGO68_gene5633 [Halteria grandinella]
MEQGVALYRINSQRKVQNQVHLLMSIGRQTLNLNPSFVHQIKAGSQLMNPRNIPAQGISQKSTSHLALLQRLSLIT